MRIDFKKWFYWVVRFLLTYVFFLFIVAALLLAIAVKWGKPFFAPLQPTEFFTVPALLALIWIIPPGSEGGEEDD